MAVVRYEAPVCQPSSGCVIIVLTACLGSALERAVLLIQDGLHSRNMRHRMDDTALWVHRFVRTKVYQLLYLVTLIANLSLGQ